MYFLRPVVWLNRYVSAYKIRTKSSYQSLIFFDLETTGFQKPIEITEICFIAVHKKHLLLSSLNSTKSLPRIIDKINLCIRPVQDIGTKAEELTSLSNQNLAEHKGFNEELAHFILFFLFRQPQPSCLVAHNGDRFDFEILASEFAKLGLEFPQNIKVSDSYKAFKNLHQRTLQPAMQRGQNCVECLDMFGFPSKPSFSLGDLYRRQFGKDIGKSHTAEGDTMALLELVVTNPEVLEYLEKGSHVMNWGRKTSIEA